MRILDKYILKNIAGTYFCVLMVFAGIYFISDVFTNLSDIIQAKTPAIIIFKYYLYMFPIIISRTSLFAMLISALYSFGEFNKNNEILSMRASGINIISICKPAAFFAFALSVLFFFAQEKILITSQKMTEEMKLQFIKKDPGGPREEKNFAFYAGDMLFFVGKFVPKEKEMRSVFIFKEDGKKNISQKIFCTSIVYDKDKWVARGVVEYKIDGEGNMSGLPDRWKEKNIGLEEKPQEIIFKKSIYAQFYSLKNLKKELKRLKKIKASSLFSNLLVDYNNKIAEPFGHFFIVMGILPLAVEIKKRRASLSSLGVGFMAGFLYYFCASLSMALAKTSVILPIFGAWLTPLVFLSFGITALAFKK